MRTIAAGTMLLMLCGCVVQPPPGNAGSYDPLLYDAGGRVVSPVAAAPVPPPADCREIERMVEIGGRQQNAYETVCRQPDGSWRITN